MLFKYAALEVVYLQSWIQSTCSQKLSACRARRVLFYLSFNQQSEYKVFYKLMCWLAGSLTCRLPNVVRSPPARRSRKFSHY